MSGLRPAVRLVSTLVNAGGYVNYALRACLLWDVHQCLWVLYFRPSIRVVFILMCSACRYCLLQCACPCVGITGITQVISSSSEASSVGCAAVCVWVLLFEVCVSVCEHYTGNFVTLKPPLWDVQQCMWVLLSKVCVSVCGHYTGNFVMH